EIGPHAGHRKLRHPEPSLHDLGRAVFRAHRQEGLPRRGSVGLRGGVPITERTPPAVLLVPHVVFPLAVPAEAKRDIRHRLRSRRHLILPDLGGPHRLARVRRPHQDVHLPSVGLPSRRHRLPEEAVRLFDPLPEFRPPLVRLRARGRIEGRPEPLDERTALLVGRQRLVLVVFLDDKEVADGTLTPRGIGDVDRRVSGPGECRHGEPAGVRQSAYYDTGIGTRGAWIERAFDGATGRGLSENVRQAYRALVDNYEPGDALYLFGFSRGAFTVRSLAGLIRNCGILRRDQRDLVESAYDYYRDPDPAKRPDTPAAEAYRRAHAVEPATIIHFIGVWDTVRSEERRVGKQ